MMRSPAFKDARNRSPSCGDTQPRRLAIGYRPEISRSLNNNVVSLVRGVVDCSQDVFALKEGVILQDFIERSPGTEKLEQIGDAKALAANAGTAPALAFLDRNSAESLQIHKCPLDSK